MITTEFKSILTLVVVIFLLTPISSFASNSSVQNCIKREKAKFKKKSRVNLNARFNFKAIKSKCQKTAKKKNTRVQIPRGSYGNISRGSYSGSSY